MTRVEPVAILHMYTLIPSVVMIVIGAILLLRKKPLGKILRIVAPAIFIAGLIFVFLFVEEAPFVYETTVRKIPISAYSQ